MTTLTKKQKIRQACTEVENGMSIGFAASKWCTTFGEVESQIAYDNTDEAMDAE